MYELLIIGGGPGGVAAGVYAASFLAVTRNSLKPRGFNPLANARFSATGKLPFSRPLSRGIENMHNFRKYV